MATAAPVAGTTGSVVLRNPTTGTPMYGAGNTATPTGAVSNASGYTVGNTQYSNTGQQVGGSTPSGTMTTTFSNPSTQQNTGAPAVITSSQAQNQIAQIQTKLQQLNGDVQAHNAAQTPAQSQDTTKPQTAPAQTTQNANQPSAGSQTQTSQDPIQTKIDSLLDSLDLGSSKNASTYQPQEDKINNAIVQNQQGYDDSYAQTATQLQQIAQGVYPLSANEQQLLAATASQFQSALTAQETANKAYTGQMTELMASLGINTSAPTQAVGNIQAAISQGNQQITDLNSKMALSLAQLQEGFQQQDYQMVYQNWQMTSGHFQQRQQTLQDLLTNVTNEQKNAQDELQQRTTMGLTALMDDHQITFEQKQQQIAQAQLDETTRHDMEQELISKYTAGMTGGGSNNSQLPTINVGPSGTPDPVGQAQFLAQFPQDVASLIKGVANYTINPSSISTSKKQSMGGFTQSQILSLASQYNPNYDEKSYATRAAMQKNITSGSYSQTINAANTAVQHLDELSKDYSQLGNKGIPFINAGYQALSRATGAAAPNNFKITADAVSSELSKIYKGTGAPAESEIENWRNSISDSMSPAQFQGALKTAVNLMAGKLSTLSDNYQSTMGQPGNFQILTDRNAQVLNGLGIDPSNVDPTYGNSPTLKLQSFAGTSNDNAAILQQLNQVMPNATPDEIVQTLQANGYLQ